MALAREDPRLGPRVNRAYDMVWRARNVEELMEAVRGLEGRERRVFLESPFRGFTSVLEALYMVNNREASGGKVIIDMGAPEVQVLSVLRQAVRDGATEWVRCVASTHPRGASMVSGPVMDGGLTPLAYSRLLRERGDQMVECLLSLGASDSMPSCGFSRRHADESAEASQSKRQRI